MYDIGMIGLGVMGRNFALNLAAKGVSVVGYDLDTEKQKALGAEAGKLPARSFADLPELIAALKTPKRIMLLVPAGPPVDNVIKSVLPFLRDGDVLIDAGNSHFTDTKRRQHTLKEKNIILLGSGISGGEAGARNGPSIMPGGDTDACNAFIALIEKSAASAQGKPCIANMGSGSAGHYVKMVHNGIEYGLMQLIAESYDLLRNVGGLSPDALHEVFSNWNAGKLNGYLIEITAAIFAARDTDGKNYLIDRIRDAADAKGTGMWTAQSAFDLHVPVPVIDAAVTARDLSDNTILRKALKRSGQLSYTQADITGQLEKALHAAFMLTYAQGFALIHAASSAYGYGTQLAEVAAIWRGGCIIRSAMLEKFIKVFSAVQEPENMLMDKMILDEIETGIPGMRTILQTGIANAIPLPACSAALAYYDSLRGGALPANLIQAQRDFFGSHTYRRNDREGIFHTQWQN